MLRNKWKKKKRVEKSYSVWENKRKKYKANTTEKKNKRYSIKMKAKITSDDNYL